VPDAAPTLRNQRATSWPAPISANDPKTLGSRLMESAFWCVSIGSEAGTVSLQKYVECSQQRTLPQCQATNHSWRARMAGTGYSHRLQYCKDAHPLRQPDVPKRDAPSLVLSPHLYVFVWAFCLSGACFFHPSPTHSVAAQYPISQNRSRSKSTNSNNAASAMASKELLVLTGVHLVVFRLPCWH